jgi:hypothetical protein
MNEVLWENPFNETSPLSKKCHKNKRNIWNGLFKQTLSLLKNMENIGLQHLHNHENHSKNKNVKK